ncbi:hypothetical protein AN958_12843 [Leucoagaricus sp. SymC.cos]|nr:hypothetical protein AN958_12843 [Leucoagaricus sp. SymC.cos]
MKICNANGFPNYANKYAKIEFTTDGQNQNIKATVTDLGQPQFILRASWL